MILCTIRVDIAVNGKALLSAILGLVFLTTTVTVADVVTVNAEFCRQGSSGETNIVDKDE